MDGIALDVNFDPKSFRAFNRNEGHMTISISGSAESPAYWCECDITAKSPLSLAHDTELGAGHIRIGIFRGKAIEKKIRIYTRPNNYPENYPVAITLFVYGEDGTIAGRVEKRVEIECKDTRGMKDGKDV
jgi:hypothetical protein